MKRMCSILLAMAIMLAYIPGVAFADDKTATGNAGAAQVDANQADDVSDEELYDDSEDLGDEDVEFEEVVEFSETVSTDDLQDVDIPSQDELLEGYIVKNTLPEGESKLLSAPRSWSLTGKNLIYYNEMKKLAQKVAAGETSTSFTTFAAAPLLSKKTYTASELGVSKLATKSGNKLVLTEAAKKKLNKLFAPEDNNAVLTAALVDMPYELYWFNKAQGYTFKAYYLVKISGNKLTINTSAANTFCTLEMPVVKYYAANSSVYNSCYVNTYKTKAVAATIDNAKDIIDEHAGESDYTKLKSYLEEICELTDYNEEAYNDMNHYSGASIYGDPWQLIYVFDGDPDTKVVCEGYGKAYKFLCDQSEFRSNWIECQTIYGTIANYKDGTMPGTGGGHLWCTVRMNDGKNYIVDPTWYDDGYDVFLKGGTGNSSYCDVKANNLEYPSYYTNLRYRIDEDFHDIFTDDELSVATSDYAAWHDSEAYDELIDISDARITGEKLYYTGEPLTDEHPVVQVDGRTLTEGVDYIVGDFTNNVNVGKALFTIIGTGQYTGAKKGTFSIGPKNVTSFSLAKAKKAFTVKWKKQATKMSKTRITGYQIQYSTSSTFASGNKSVKVAGYGKVSRKITGLKAKKTYYVRIRTYKVVSGTTYYSAWSEAKSVKTK